MTESEKVMAPGLREFFYVFYKEEDMKNDSIEEPVQIPFIPEYIDLIEKKRGIKRWKESFSYYCFHPEKFRFGLKDLK